MIPDVDGDADFAPMTNEELARRFLALFKPCEDLVEADAGYTF
jgi:hypothetical protein